MGDLKAAALAPRNPGGQPHKLHTVLANMTPEDAADLREIFASDAGGVNWTELAKAMTARGFHHSVSTWQRWSDDWRRDPARFDG